jgi:hypothetical protein
MPSRVSHGQGLIAHKRGLKGFLASTPWGSVERGAGSAPSLYMRPCIALPIVLNPLALKAPQSEQGDSVLRHQRGWVRRSSESSRAGPIVNSAHARKACTMSDENG